MRNLEEDKAKIGDYWEMDYIDDGEDIAMILQIAEHSTERAIAAELRIAELEDALQTMRIGLEMLMSSDIYAKLTKAMYK